MFIIPSAVHSRVKWTASARCVHHDKKETSLIPRSWGKDEVRSWEGPVRER